MQVFLLNFLYFWIYSFLGWAVESTICSVNEHKIINRGFLSGPICPIYGSGAMIVILSLTPFLAHPVFLFIDAVVLTSILEYFTSYAMEKLFHARWWDYSKHHFNLNGRICLKSSLFFGVLSLAVMYLLHPGVVHMVGLLPQTARILISIVVLLLFAVDLFTTVRGVVNFNRQLERLAELSAQIKAKLDSLPGLSDLPFKERLERFFQEKREELQESGSGVRESVNSMMERFRSLSTQHGFIQRRLKRAFPHMTLHKNTESVRSLKEWLENKRKHED